MTISTTLAARAIVGAYDFKPFDSVCDIGGGQGILLKTILSANPHLRGILYDQESVVANHVLAEVGQRVEIQTGSFFERVPAADVLVMKSVIHDWDDERCQVILRRCREVMQPASRLLVVDMVIASGSEQAMLLPMIEQASAYRTPDTLVTADAGYHSDANIARLQQQNIAAMVADNQMRSRDERFENQDKYKDKPDPLSEKKATGQAKDIKRFGPKDFCFHDDNTATCPAGKVMTSSGNLHTLASGLHYQTYTAKEVDCNVCTLSKQCLKGPLKPNDGRGRKVTRFEPKIKDPAHPSERMRQAIDSPRGRQLYSQRIDTVEPVFGNIRHNKRLTRLNHRGRTKVNTQWNLYCMVHNIEKLAKTDLGRRKD